MAIAPTGDIFKGLEFDGESSKAYGVYITGEAVYNAPEREVEMISIPGRNGAFALDRGRFENIEVTYPAGIYADSEFDFANAISDFRNFLCSRKGYVRLIDDYNPDEYRLAIYKSGLEVSPAQLKAGQFDIIFECQPQRFLVSGEDEMVVEDGETVTNPTHFDSRPLLKVEGYGDIAFNGHAINIADTTYGEVTIASNKRIYHTAGHNEENRIYIPAEYRVNGDILTISGFRVMNGLTLGNWWYFYMASSPTNMTNTQTGAETSWVESPSIDESYTTYVQGYNASTTFPNITFTLGTSSSYSNTLTIPNLTVKNFNSGSTATITFTHTVTLSYVASENVVKFNFATTSSSSTIPYSYYVHGGGPYTMLDSATIDSTATLITGTIYLDCDLGEAYKIVDGEPVSLNSYIDLGSDLPTLAPGNNIVSFDNTVTDLKIIPRWWKV